MIKQSTVGYKGKKRSISIDNRQLQQISCQKIKNRIAETLKKKREVLSTEGIQFY
jgi:hypothetical protein